MKKPFISNLFETEMTFFTHWSSCFEKKMINSIKKYLIFTPRKNHFLSEMDKFIIFLVKDKKKIENFLLLFYC